MTLRTGDTLTKDRQTDGSYTVTIDVKNADGEQRYVANVEDPDAYYTRVRALADNPPERDLNSEKETLIKQRDTIDEQISDVDALIITRDGRPK